MSKGSGGGGGAHGAGGAGGRSAGVPASAGITAAQQADAVSGFGELANAWNPGRLDQVMRAYEGLSKSQINEVAAGRSPTANTANTKSPQKLPPVRGTVVIGPDNTVIRRTVIDGNHRLTGAKRAGAKSVNAIIEIVRRGPKDGHRVAKIYKGPIPI